VEAFQAGEELSAKDATVELSKKYDPQGKFRNEYLNKNIFSS